MKRIPAGNLEFWVETREGGEDGGPSIQVRATVEAQSVQLMRFDCFRKRPHYHYAPSGSDARYDIDPTVVGDSLRWAIAQLRSNLGPMVGRAGHPELADGLDAAAVTSALDEVESHFLAPARQA